LLKSGTVISYDPNLRPPLWKSLELAKEMIVLGLDFADILKVSEEELEFITGTKDLNDGTDILF
jgi:fructokinase